SGQERARLQCADRLGLARRSGGFFVRRAEKVRQARPRTARARRRRGLGRPRSLALSRRAAAQGGTSLFARRAAHQPDFSQGGMTGTPVAVLDALRDRTPSEDEPLIG